MGSRQIVLVSTAGISVLNAGIFWQEAKTKQAFFTVYLLTTIVLYHVVVWMLVFCCIYSRTKPKMQVRFLGLINVRKKGKSREGKGTEREWQEVPGIVDGN